MGAAAGRLLEALNWPSWLMLWISLLLLRWELLTEMVLEFATAWDQGLGLGIHADFTASLMPAVLSTVFAGILAVPRFAGFLCVTVSLWIATWANIIYYRHFGMPLDWWVIEFHTGDIGDVSGFFLQLSWSWRVALSLLLAVGALPVFLWSARRFSGRAVEDKPSGWLSAAYVPVQGRILDLGAMATGTFWRNRISGLAVGVGLVLLFFAVQQSPRAFHIYGFPNPLNSHILQVWYQQKLKSRPYSGVARDEAREFGIRSQAGFGGNPGAVLAMYRDFREAEWLAGANGADNAAGTAGSRPRIVQGGKSAAFIKTGTMESGGARLDKPDGNGSAGITGGGGTKARDRGAPADWPLLRKFAADPERTKAARALLGLPEQGPINVIMLLIESLRYWDIAHPEVGPQVFPRLRSIFRNNAVLFSQGYSSSVSAGQTVRGSFSTFCSFLPNMGGPATYMAYPTVRIRCLPELMKENGYVTLWFNSHRANAHNKKFFEGSNGVDHFYDKVFFQEKGVTEIVSDLGLGDGPVLQETLKKILEWSEIQDAPLYVQIVTVSTHGPVRPVASIRFSEAFEKSAGRRQLYRDYMTMFRYTDEAIGNFIAGLFRSPIGDNTVVLLLGDHAHGTLPHVPITPIQRMDLPHRIPIAVISKNIKRPEVRRRQVHQVDVAPTAAMIAGVSGEVTWVGGDLFAAGDGSPFVYSSSSGFSWRTQSIGCYNGKCVNLKGKDPAFDAELPALPPQPELERFFRRVVEANGFAISTNRISPRN